MGEQPPIEYERWQYTFSGWLRLIKCKDMTNKEEVNFHQRLWSDSEFAAMIYNEYEDWQAEGDPMPTLEELKERQIERELLKKKSRRYTGKYKGRGKERL